MKSSTTLNAGKPLIYESPDGGNTIYARSISSLDRHLISKNEGAKDLDEHKLWVEIRLESKKNPRLRKLVERLIIDYHLIK